MVILLKGKSTQPFIHFEIPSSDYITAGRRNPNLPGPFGALFCSTGIDAETRIIEFHSIGIGFESKQYDYLRINFLFDFNA